MVINVVEIFTDFGLRTLPLNIKRTSETSAYLLRNNDSSQEHYRSFFSWFVTYDDQRWWQILLLLDTWLTLIGFFSSFFTWIHSIVYMDWLLVKSNLNWFSEFWLTLWYIGTRNQSSNYEIRRLVNTFIIFYKSR